MVQEVTGDILLTQAAAIAHGIAPGDAFNQGLAHSLRELWPALYKDFRHFCHAQNPEEGGVWVWRGAGGPAIVNLFTQERAPDGRAHPGRATVQNVSHALRELRKVVEKEKFASLALPRLATGVGGLSWDQVKPLIAQHLGNLGIPVYVYVTFQKGVKANEQTPTKEKHV